MSQVIYVGALAFGVAFLIGTLNGWAIRDWFKTRPPLSVREQIRAAEYRVAKDAQAYWTKHINRLLASQCRRMADELDLRAEFQRAFALCDLHQPDKWEGDGTCVICEGHQLREALTQAQATAKQRERV